MVETRQSAVAAAAVISPPSAAWTPRRSRGLVVASLVLLGTFLLEAAWIIALAVWRIGRIEERWSSDLAG